MVFFDEAGFSSEEIIAVSEAFATQNSDFKTSTNQEFNLDTQRKKNPTQLIFASSASSSDTIFYKKYKEYAKKMILGDDRYFVADIPCDIPLAPLLDGEEHPPLLKKEQVEDAIRDNYEKAMREYYNKFSTDGGEAQAVKRASIVRNSVNVLPVLFNEDNKQQFIFAFDPARSYDNSICSVMKISHDDKIGYYGEIVNVVSFADLSKKKKTPMKITEQIKYLKQMLLDYNGDQNPDYENILAVMIDSGAGGGGMHITDHLLEDWQDKKGETHKGLIDLNHEQYKNDSSMYPNSVNIVQLINPRKLKSQMAEELIQLIELDLIKFTREYDGKDTVKILKGAELEDYKVSLEEEIALKNIDLMKEETVAIHRTVNGSNVSFDIPKDKKSRIGDDRFYTLLLCAHFLFELRRNNLVNKPAAKIDWSNAPMFSSEISF